jgi:hypothetical protein
VGGTAGDLKSAFSKNVEKTFFPKFYPDSKLKVLKTPKHRKNFFGKVQKCHFGVLGFSFFATLYTETRKAPEKKSAKCQI